MPACTRKVGLLQNTAAVHVSPALAQELTGVVGGVGKAEGQLAVLPRVLEVDAEDRRIKGCEGGEGECA